MLCWFCIVQNFWQATKASLLWGYRPRTGRQPFVPLHLCIDSLLCRCIVQRLCVAHYASLHSGFVWLTASILAWSRGGSPSKIPLSPRERGQGDRGSELEVCFKNILFLQTEPCIALMHGFYVIGCSFQRSAYPLRSFRHAVLQAIHSYCSRLLRPCREFLRFRC